MWWLVSVAAATAAATLTLSLARRRYALVTVTGRSMEPTYRDGDRVLVKRRAPHSLRIGEVVVIQEPARDDGPAAAQHDVDPLARRWMIKRVLALPGDPVPRREVPALTTVPEEVVPPDCIVVVGDAGRRSYDSKQAGYFALGRVLGVVIRPVLTRGVAAAPER
ncbi:hypothetical protein TK50_07775 [Micromonospora haikouensis]|uniref:Peptidase S26 domain-containing protein n=1 Tax=Micromonospora haikouensis TaxID=686309 RepID=A0A0D0X791_9ACTN|nr:hypothetical protein TK50_07775 [Micromonospora haikouensis]